MIKHDIMRIYPGYLYQIVFNCDETSSFTIKILISTTDVAFILRNAFVHFPYEGQCNG